MDQKDKVNITEEYKKKVLEHVASQVKLNNRKIRDVLSILRVPPSSYYLWKNEAKKTMAIQIPIKGIKINDLLPQEKTMILGVKERNPHLRHRQIQGLIQLQGHYISPSSVYKVLKENDLVEDFNRRPSPLKVPLYEIQRKNILWSEDWTKILIGWTKWNLLAVIDTFSRLVVAWDLVPQVSSGDIERIYQQGIKNQNLKENLPTMRADRGSPNTSTITKDFFNDLGALLSFARVRRPTDNAHIERFFGTLKQEEVYIAVNYPDEKTARESIGEYIEYYNRDRPHQSLWNFTPQHCHDINNKTDLLNELSDLKRKSKIIRKELRAARADNEFIQENICLIREYNEFVMQQNF
jgi:putative transposase